MMRAVWKFWDFLGRKRDEDITDDNGRRNRFGNTIYQIVYRFLLRVRLLLLNPTYYYPIILAGQHKRGCTFEAVRRALPVVDRTEFGRNERKLGADSRRLRERNDRADAQRAASRRR